MAVIIIPTITYLKASPAWWGIFLLIIGATLAAELFNTSLEYLCDRLHPDYDPQIGKVKDCAAAAVLIPSHPGVLGGEARVEQASLPVQLPGGRSGLPSEALA